MFSRQQILAIGLGGGWNLKFYFKVQNLSKLNTIKCLLLTNFVYKGPQLPPDSRGWRGRGEGAEAEVWCESVHPRGDHGEDCGQQVAGNDGDHDDGDVDDDDVCCQVHAKHEESTGGKSVYREYNREFLLPQGTNPELIKSSLSKVFITNYLLILKYHISLSLYDISHIFSLSDDIFVTPGWSTDCGSSPTYPSHY